MWQRISLSHLAGAFLMLNIADGAMTEALMKIGGAPEFSPIWNFFLEHTTVTEFVLVKLMGALAICEILLLLGMTYNSQVKRILAGLVVGMTVVFTISAINISAYFVGLTG
jgi:hypothetical protein